MGRIEDLQKLKELKDTGTLTEAEYEVEKYKILNSNDENNSNNTNNKNSVRALIGFILGLCSLVAWYIPIIGFPVTILGIIFSAFGINSNRKGMAIAGLILSIIFFVITIINSIAGAVVMSRVFSNYF